MKDKGVLVIGVILVLVGVIGAAAAFAWGQRPMMSSDGTSLPGTRGSAGAGTVERMFIQEMVPHHQDAID
ncbi:MAG: hypothetical protein ACYC6C_13255, partial [Coriobacteriia bacterium]